jgi:hypothetical protein
MGVLSSRLNIPAVSSGAEGFSIGSMKVLLMFKRVPYYLLEECVVHTKKLSVAF